MKKIQNVSINKDSIRVHVMRDGVNRSRRFLVSKFGGMPTAIKKATQYAQYLQMCTEYQFECATRSVGRPFKTEYFGRRSIKS